MEAVLQLIIDFSSALLLVIGTYPPCLRTIILGVGKEAEPGGYSGYSGATGNF